MVVIMNDKPPTHTQDLREAVASIISMMLGLLRAQGWRGLLRLPEIAMGVFLLRGIGKRFGALLGAHAPAPRPLAPASPAPPELPGAAGHPRSARPSARAVAPRRRRPSQPARAV